MEKFMNVNDSYNVRKLFMKHYTTSIFSTRPFVRGTQGR